MIEKLAPNHPESAEQRNSLEHIDLNAEQVNELLFRSFYYSQGTPVLQTHIMAYIAHRHPEWKVSEGVKEETLKLAHARNTNLVLGGSHVRQEEEKIMRESKQRLEELCQILNSGYVTLFGQTTEAGPNGSVTVSVDDIPNEVIMHGMINRDLKFVDLGGRPNRSNTASAHFRKHMSHFVDYVLLEKRAPGPAVFEEMMEDLRSLVKDPGSELKEKRGAIQDLVKYHNEHNPDEPVDLSKYPDLL